MKLGCRRTTTKNRRTTTNFKIIITIKSKTISKDFQAEQLSLIFSKDENNDIEKEEKLKVFADFRRKFLDIAIKEINNNSHLDITNLKVEPIKTGKKITSLYFTFKKKMNVQNMNAEEKKCYDYFLSFGFAETQILHLLNRIGYENMYAMFNDKISTKKSEYGFRFYHKSTKNEIKSLSGFLYENVFNNYLKPIKD